VVLPVILAAGCLPWFPQTWRTLVGAWRATVDWGRFDLHRLLWVWCVFVLRFISPSHSKLSPYILPMFPALALFSASEPGRPRPKDAEWSLVLTLAVVIVLVVLAATGVDYHGELSLGLSEMPNSGIAVTPAFERVCRSAPDALAVMAPKALAKLQGDGLPRHVAAATHTTVIVDKK
jgi:hypothetical protein